MIYPSTKNQQEPWQPGHYIQQNGLAHSASDYAKGLKSNPYYYKPGMWVTVLAADLAIHKMMRG